MIHLTIAQGLTRDGESVTIAGPVVATQPGDNIIAPVIAAYQAAVATAAAEGKFAATVLIVDNRVSEHHDFPNLKQRKNDEQKARIINTANRQLSDAESELKDLQKRQKTLEREAARQRRVLLKNSPALRAKAKPLRKPKLRRKPNHPQNPQKAKSQPLKANRQKLKAKS